MKTEVDCFYLLISISVLATKPKWEKTFRRGNLVQVGDEWMRRKAPQKVQKADSLLSWEEDVAGGKASHSLETPERVCCLLRGAAQAQASGSEQGCNNSVVRKASAVLGTTWSLQLKGPAKGQLQVCVGDLNIKHSKLEVTNPIYFVYKSHAIWLKYLPLTEPKKSLTTNPAEEKWGLQTALFLHDATPCFRDTVLSHNCTMLSMVWPQHLKCKITSLSL